MCRSLGLYKLVAQAWQLSRGKLNTDCSTVNMESYGLCHIVIVSPFTSITVFSDIEDLE